MEVSKSDWKLFRVRIAEWQENYMECFWKRAPFILVTGIAHIWWLAQLTAVPGNKIGTGMTFPGISGIFNNSCVLYFFRDGGRVFVYDRRNGAESTSLYQFLFNINSFCQC